MPVRSSAGHYIVAYVMKPTISFRGILSGARVRLLRDITENEASIALAIVILFVLLSNGGA